ncbi:MAG TPA: ABC transporter permease [Actinomycetota bacterium]|nr:ABC transporter permease [Actinomycetota bacterium]
MKTEEGRTTAVDEPVLPPPVRGKISPRKLRRARQRKAIARFWAQFRTSKMGMAGLIILIFFSVMAISSIFADKGRLDPTITTNGPILAPPSLQYPLGTDDYGISVLSLVVEGSRISLFIGLVATVISMLLGSGIGIWSGYKAGIQDTSLMFVTDAFLVLPWLALAIVLAAIFGQNVWVIIAIIGFTSWAGTARLVRAQVLSVKERTYIERSRALGASDWHVVSRHVLPNVMPVIFANTILTIAIAILSESALSFLGLGNPLQVTWGTIIEKAFRAGALTLGAWWWLLAPSACIVLVVLAFTMVGFAFDDIVNPRIRER